MRKQEKMVESNQRKLAERIEDANRRNEELAKLLDLQRQTLHQLSGLSRRKRPPRGCSKCSMTSCRTSKRR